MAQINLLKQNTGRSFTLDKSVPKILVRLCLVILLAAIGYYGWLYFKSKSMDNQTAALKVKINSEIQEGLGEKGRSELLTRQLQIKTLGGLIASHLYWSQLFRPLAEATLKNASYSSVQTGADGSLTLNVTVPTLEDLDKYLQVFNIPKFNQNFSNVILGGYTEVKGKGSTGYQFQVQLKYNPQLIQYKDSNANAG